MVEMASSLSAYCTGIIIIKNFIKQNWLKLISAAYEEIKFVVIEFTHAREKSVSFIHIFQRSTLNMHKLLVSGLSLKKGAAKQFEVEQWASVK